MAKPVNTSCPVNGVQVPENGSNHGRTYCEDACKKAANDLAAFTRSLGAVEWPRSQPRREFRKQLMALANSLWRPADTARDAKGRFR